jgi:two-component system NtrC family response regulator
VCDAEGVLGLPMARILIIDDDKRVCEALSLAINHMGHRVFNAFTLKDGLRTIKAERIDVVLLDVRMPDGNGLAILPEIRKGHHRPEVIIITGAGDLNGAELAIKSGAWDYIQKPLSLQDMTLPITRALQYREEKLKRKNIPLALKREGIVGSSPKMLECLDLVAQASASKANVLITGETGSGKEIFARAIHQNSPRHQKSFVVVDCSAIPETLVESILFGHEKGAFTGAEKTTEGMFKQADGGTLFLDEVGELPLTMQKRFLRVLQDHRFRPLGSNE